jgi:broad specificity phosphatase PhoE
MQTPLKRLIHEGHGLLQLLKIYCTIACRFWRWRVGLWFQTFRRVENSQTLMKQTLLIIRHGQTSWNVENRLPGQLPGVALNETGRQQAVRLAEALSVLPISAIISSPLERAYVTATYVGQKRDLTIQLEPDLMDTNIGPWAGEVIRDLAKKDPAWGAYVKDPTEAPEGVETFPQVQQRVVAAIERWLTQDGIGPYPAFVAHADVIKLLLAHYTGLEIKRAGSLHIDNASVSLVVLEDERPPHVMAIGWSPHPGWLKSPIAEIAQQEKPEGTVDEQKT